MTTHLEEFEAQQAERAAQQDQINALFAEKGEDAAHTAIVALADAEHAPYPQYKGYWAGPEWILGRTTAQLRGKGGTMAEEGDVVLMRRDYGDGVVFFSVRLVANCVVNYGIRPLMGWANAYAVWTGAEARRHYEDHRRYLAEQYGPETAARLPEPQ
jgi:hypothetical protein